MRKKGLSLLEAIIASFLLVSAFLVVINLFHAGLGHSVNVEKEQAACLLANRYLEGMRLWSESLSGTAYNYETLAAVYDGRSETIDDYTRFQVNTRVTAVTLYSACSNFESTVGALNLTTNFPMGTRQLPAANNSTQSVRVSVSWDGAGQPLVLNTYLCRPIPNPRAVNPVVVSVQASTPYVAGSGTLLPHGDTGNGLNLTATAFDGNNNPLRDIFFEWTVVPTSGDASLLQSRDGSVANLTNVIRPSGTPKFTGGRVTVVAQAKIHGVNVTGSFGPIELAP